MKPGKKQSNKLGRRIADYAAMMNNTQGKAYKAPPGAYHKPGSNQK